MSNTGTGSSSIFNPGGKFPTPSAGQSTGQSAGQSTTANIFKQFNSTPNTNNYQLTHSTVAQTAGADLFRQKAQQPGETPFSSGKTNFTMGSFQQKVTDQTKGGTNNGMTGIPFGNKSQQPNSAVYPNKPTSQGSGNIFSMAGGTQLGGTGSLFGNLNQKNDSTNLINSGQAGGQSIGSQQAKQTPFSGGGASSNPFVAQKKQQEKPNMFSGQTKSNIFGGTNTTVVNQPQSSNLFGGKTSNQISGQLNATGQPLAGQPLNSFTSQSQKNNNKFIVPSNQPSIPTPSNQSSIPTPSNQGTSHPTQISQPQASNMFNPNSSANSNSQAPKKMNIFSPNQSSINPQNPQAGSKPSIFNNNNQNQTSSNLFKNSQNKAITPAVGPLGSQSKPQTTPPQQSSANIFQRNQQPSTPSQITTNNNSSQSNPTSSMTNPIPKPFNQPAAATSNTSNIFDQKKTSAASGSIPSTTTANNNSTLFQQTKSPSQKQGIFNALIKKPEQKKEEGKEEQKLNIFATENKSSPKALNNFFSSNKQNSNKQQSLPTAAKQAISKPEESKKGINQELMKAKIDLERDSALEKLKSTSLWNKITQPGRFKTNQQLQKIGHSFEQTSNIVIFQHLKRTFQSKLLPVRFIILFILYVLIPNIFRAEGLLVSLNKELKSQLRIRKLTNQYQLIKEEGSSSYNQAILQTLISKITSQILPNNTYELLNKTNFPYKLNLFQDLPLSVILRTLNNYLFDQGTTVPNRESLLKYMQQANNRQSGAQLELYFRRQHQVAFKKYLDFDFKCQTMLLKQINQFEQDQIQSFQPDEFKYNGFTDRFLSYLQSGTFKRLGFQQKDRQDHYFNRIGYFSLVVEWINSSRYRPLNQSQKTIYFAIKLIQHIFKPESNLLERIQRQQGQITISQMVFMVISYFSALIKQHAQQQQQLGNKRELQGLFNQIDKLITQINKVSMHPLPCRSLIITCFQLAKISLDMPQKAPDCKAFMDICFKNDPFLYMTKLLEETVKTQNLSSDCWRVFLSLANQFSQKLGLTVIDVSQKMERITNQFLQLNKLLIKHFPQAISYFQRGHKGHRFVELLLNGFPNDQSTMINFYNETFNVLDVNSLTDNNQTLKFFYEDKFQSINNLDYFTITLKNEIFRQLYNQDHIFNLVIGNSYDTTKTSLLYQCIQVPQQTQFTVLSKKTDRLSLQFKMRYSGWKILFYLCSVWAERAQTISQHQSLVKDTRQISSIVKFVITILYHCPNLYREFASNLKQIQQIELNEQQDIIDLDVFMQFIARLTYTACRIIPQESQSLVCSFLRMIRIILEKSTEPYQKTKAIYFLYKQITYNNYPILRNLLNSNTDRERTFEATKQILMITQYFISDQMISEIYLDRKLIKILKYLFQDGLMRVVQTYNRMKPDKLQYFFSLMVKTLQLLQKVLKIVYVNPIKSPLIFMRGSNPNDSNNGKSIPSHFSRLLQHLNIVQLLERILQQQYIKFDQKTNFESTKILAQNRTPLYLKPLQIKRYKSKMFSILPKQDSDSIYFKNKLINLQCQALRCLNLMIDLVISNKVLKHPQNSNFVKQLEHYLKGKIDYKAMSCVVPSLGANYIDDLDQKLSTGKRKNNDLVLSIFQYIGASVSYDYENLDFNLLKQLDTQAFISLTKIIFLRSFKGKQGFSQLLHIRSGGVASDYSQFDSVFHKIEFILQRNIPSISLVQCIFDFMNVGYLSDRFSYTFIKRIVDHWQSVGQFILNALTNKRNYQLKAKCLQLLRHLITCNREFTTQQVQDNNTKAQFEEIHDKILRFCQHNKIGERVVELLDGDFNSLVQEEIPFFEQLSYSISRANNEQQEADNLKNYSSAIFAQKLQNLATKKQECNQLNTKFQSIKDIKLLHLQIIYLLQQMIEQKIVNILSVKDALINSTSAIANQMLISYQKTRHLTQPCHVIIEKFQNIFKEQRAVRNLQNQALVGNLNNQFMKDFCLSHTLRSHGQTYSIADAYINTLFYSNQGQAVNQGELLLSYQNQNVAANPFAVNLNYKYDPGQLVYSTILEYNPTLQSVYHNMKLVLAYNCFSAYNDINQVLIKRFFCLCLDVFRFRGYELPKIAPQKMGGQRKKKRSLL